MRFHALATDYDGTIATHGVVDEATIAALERLLASGRRLIMVTGRELPDLMQAFPRLDLFEIIVAENGALLYWPATKREKVLAEKPSDKFVELLQERGVAPLSVGRAIVATWRPFELIVLETIRELGLDLQVIFNKEAVMVLPASVNKATGLKAALRELGLSRHNTVAVGDAENDHAFLKYCEFSAAVDNALPAVKETADMVTVADHGAGVVQLIDAMIHSDLADLEPHLARHHVPLGSRNGEEVSIRPYGPTMLIAGPSASGKSTLTTAFLEALAEREYQFCIVDPEGDYQNFTPAAVIGGPDNPPNQDDIQKALAKGESVVVSMTGMPIADRPPFFLGLLPQLLQMRARSGRPHWIVLDEVHHLMPAQWKPPEGLLPEQLSSFLMITVHPEMLSADVLKRVTAMVAVGKDADQTIGALAKAIGRDVPTAEPERGESGEVLLWSIDSNEPAIRVKTNPSKTERRRHRRKYAEGELAPDRSFYFKGADGKLNLRAQNLILFMQTADGVDDVTWQYHLSNGDYARWFRDGIKDEALAAEAERVASLSSATAAESRSLIRTAIERDYTLPGTAPLPVAGAS